MTLLTLGWGEGESDDELDDKSRHGSSSMHNKGGVGEELEGLKAKVIHAQMKHLATLTWLAQMVEQKTHQ